MTTLVPPGPGTAPDATPDANDRANAATVATDGADVGSVDGDPADAAAVRDWLLGLQSRIVAALEAEGGDRFGTDAWTRPAGGPLEGDGITRIVEDGALLERGGCGFSHVRGARLPAAATQHRGAELADAPFEAMGVSVVFHPRNPYVPTVHMNVRMLVALPAERAPVAWFGGGMDLTPYYGFEDDARHFHTTARDALAPFGPELHPRFKAWCDRYFRLPHRDEPRGVGGIFFDDVDDGGVGNGFALVRAVGDAFLAAYLPIVERRKGLPYGERERAFQAYRRGRYVEFNLVCDRGTLFGLQSGGRTESILMSMPPLAAWRYDWAPEPGSAEARLYSEFLRPRDWVGDGA